MILRNALKDAQIIFIDTAPIIYFIEAHPEFGPLAKEIVESFQAGEFTASSSVITLAEVLAKPVETGNEILTRKFADFLKHGKKPPIGRDFHRHSGESRAFERAISTYQSY